MSNLWVARRDTRQGFFIKTEGTKANPSLMFFLPGMDSHQLDQLVRSELSKQGVTEESAVNQAVEKAELEYERRRKTEEAQQEVKRLMKIKAEGGTKRLMQTGFRRWKEVYYPSAKQYMDKQEKKNEGN
jgi:hypothetical protein